MKKVYLVRHGQTHSNINGLLKDYTDELTDDGRKQAMMIAERFRTVPIDKIFASDYVRTRQTVAPIAELKGLDVEFSENFREEKVPSSLVGSSELEGNGADFVEAFYQNAADPEWRYEDGENATDAYNRIKRALLVLENDPNENILVVTHGNFLKPFTAHVLLDEKGSVEQVTAMRKTFKTTNTGVTVVYHDNSRWRVLTWNDHAHFAE